MALLSCVGGYYLWKSINGINDYYRQHTEMVLGMQEGIDDATIALGRQIQEWKDMLLRANDTELYDKHKKAFFKYSSDVQLALLNTKSIMQSEHMDTTGIEQVLLEHQSLSSDYVMAKSMLNPREIDSFREVDKQVIGVDRSLQKQLTALRAEIRLFSKRQLDGTIFAQGNDYLAGLFEACSLMIMALAGFVIATRFAGHKSW